MAAVSTIERSTDRRRDRRDRKDGPVYLSDSSGWGDLSVGTVLNRSTQGLAVFSETPYTIGTVVDLEVFDEPRLATSRLKIVRGTIQNVHPHLRGGYRMGVRVQGIKRVAPKKVVLVAPTNLNKPTTLRPTLKSTLPAKRFSRPTSHRMRNTFITLIAIVCVAVFLLNWNDVKAKRGYELGSATYYQSPAVSAEPLTLPPLPYEERNSSGTVGVEEASLFESRPIEYPNATWVAPRRDESVSELVDDATEESGLDMPLASETLAPSVDVAPLRRGLDSGVRNRWDVFPFPMEQHRPLKRFAMQRRSMFRSLNLY